MAGTITIKDGSTVKYVFTPISLIQLYEISIEVTDASGELLPRVDHNKVVSQTITVNFELTDKGTYNGAQPPGTTGSRFKQKALLNTLKNQPTTSLYTLIEDDDTENTAGYTGAVLKILFDRQMPGNKITGNLVFIQSDDLYKV